MIKNAIMGFTLIGISMTAQAQLTDDSGFYIAAGVGRASIDGDIDSDQINVNYDDKENVYSYRGGYMFNNWLGVELGYHDFDEYDQFTDRIGSGLTNSSLDLKAYTAAAVVNVPVTLVDVYAKGGVAYLDADIDGQIGGLNVSTSDTFTEPFGAVGAELDFGTLNLFAEYTQIFDTDNVTVDFYTAGLKIEF